MELVIKYASDTHSYQLCNIQQCVFERSTLSISNAQFPNRIFCPLPKKKKQPNNDFAVLDNECECISYWIAWKMFSAHKIPFRAINNEKTWIIIALLLYEWAHKIDGWAKHNKICHPTRMPHPIGWSASSTVHSVCVILGWLKAVEKLLLTLHVQWMHCRFDVTQTDFIESFQPKKWKTIQCISVCSLFSVGSLET